MGIDVIISPEGQVMIPRDVLDALGLAGGARLQLSYSGNQIMLETSKPATERISYEEFRRRVPRYEGPPVAAEDMTSQVGELFREWDA